ncbi:helix-turn-helix domain-containing protein [Spirillospora sp. NPDC048832]|jgi:AcrR family transcriptional regulator
MRADARRNRERITASALGLFAARGPGVSMEEIAKDAGLGVGTLYRHFPDRRALVAEISESALVSLAAELRRLADQDGPRWDVLTRFIAYCAGLPLALIKSLTVDGTLDLDENPLQQEVDALIRGLIEQAQREGSLRSDITPGEAAEILSTATCRPGARPDDALTRVILDGLRP